MGKKVTMGVRKNGGKGGVVVGKGWQWWLELGRMKGRGRGRGRCGMGKGGQVKKHSKISTQKIPKKYIS